MLGILVGFRDYTSNESSNGTEHEHFNGNWDTTGVSVVTVVWVLQI